MDNKTQYLLDAAKYIIYQADDPESGGRDFTNALIDLKIAVAEFED